MSGRIKILPLGRWRPVILARIGQCETGFFPKLPDRCQCEDGAEIGIRAAGKARKASLSQRSGRCDPMIILVDRAAWKHKLRGHECGLLTALPHQYTRSVCIAAYKHNGRCIADCGLRRGGLRSYTRSLQALATMSEALPAVQRPSTRPDHQTRASAMPTA